MSEGSIAADDPRAADMRALLERHLAFASEHSPPEDVHALELDGLLAADIAYSPNSICMTLALDDTRHER